VWNLAGFLKENRRVADICVTTALLMAGHSCVAPVLPLFADEFGATAAQVGMTLSAFAAARLVLNVPCGVIADRHGRKPLIVAGPLITAVGMMGSAACTGLPELFFWRFIAGAGSAVYMAGAQALLADASTPANRARVLGANQAAVLAGAAVGPALGGPDVRCDGARREEPVRGGGDDVRARGVARRANGARDSKVTRRFKRRCATMGPRLSARCLNSRRPATWASRAAPAAALV
jgi:hypothetical protein